MLRIYHIVTHMRLEPAPIDPNAVITAASPVTTPVTPSEHVPYPENNELDIQVKYAMSSVSDPEIEADDVPASTILRLEQHRNSRYGDVSPASPSTPDPGLRSAQGGLEVVDQPRGSVVSSDSAVWPEPGRTPQQPAGSLAFLVTPARPAIPNCNPKRTAEEIMAPAHHQS